MTFENETPFRVGSPPADSNAKAVPVVPPHGRPAAFFALNFGGE